MLKVREASTWNEVGCVVRQIAVKVHAGDGDTYSPEVAFDYTVAGQRYTGDQFWFGSGSYGDRKAIEDAIAPFQVGGEYPCYVNPKDPRVAVLTRQVAAHAWLGWLFGGIFGTVGAVAMLACLRGYFGTKQKAASQRSTTSWNRSESLTSTFAKGGVDPDDSTENRPHYDFDSSVCPIEGEGPDEPMVLATKGSRIGTAIGSWFFALIWNGISWTVGYFVLKDFHWFAAIFFSIFALFGVAIFLFAIYSTLQIWNPQTTVVCSQRHLYPGSEFEISWLHQGNSSSIVELSIELEGQESATYRQGTTTRTDKNVFFKQTIVKTNEPNEIAAGFRVYHLPEDTMHTFESSKNSITWQIQVHGKIGFWPDILDAYSITIYPPMIEGANHAES